MSRFKRVFFAKDNQVFFNWFFPSVIFLFICIAGGILQYFENVPVSDVATRYAPMAEAFRDGNWQYAFHPRIQPLMPVAGGIIAKLGGLDGFTAMKFAGILFLGLTIFPLYFLNLRLFDRGVAIFSGLFYLFCSRLWLLALAGLRDTGKAFAMMLSAYALLMIYREREKLRHYLLLTLGVALGVNCRGDFIFMGAVFLMVSYYIEYGHCRWGKYTLAALFTVWLLMLPFVLINYFNFGAAVPEMRFGMWYEAKFGVFPGIKAMLIFSAAAMVGFAIFMQILCRIPQKAVFIFIPSALVILFTVLSCYLLKRGGNYDFGDFFESLGAGFYPQYGFVALLGFYLMIRKKLMNKEHGLILFILFFHAIALVLQIMISEKTFYVGRRYLLSAAPLYFGFSAWTLLELRRMLTKWCSEKWSWTALVTVSLLFVIIEMLWFGNRVRKDFTSKKHRTILEAAAAIRNDRDYAACKEEKISAAVNFRSYVPSASVLVSLEKNNHTFDTVPYCAGARIALPGEKAHYAIEKESGKKDSRRVVKIIEIKKKKFVIFRY